jgi:ATP-dependent DNA helicase RecQ
MDTTRVAAGKLLRRSLGANAQFHDGQLEAILALVDGRERVLVVQRTGWGKSVVYFIATALLRERGAGPTILISPLLALMHDQLLMAKRLGVRAARIDSTNVDEWPAIDAALEADEIDILLIGPERLANDRFRTTTIPAIQGGIGMFVVDEAHCISDWGHDFRPDYRRIDQLVDALPRGVPLLATTATANERVQQDVAEQLGPHLRVIRGGLGRESLHLQVIELDDQAERLAWLAAYLRSVEGTGIVYTLTVLDAVRVSAWLEEQGIDAPPYYGALGTQERRRLEQRLRTDDVKALVATVALGMGFDKPDLRFVVHFQRPGSAVFYYQQIGRAGRNVPRAEVVLLAGSEDDAIATHFINTAFPPVENLEQVLAAVEAGELVHRSGLEVELNLSRSAIDNALTHLVLERAVTRVDGAYVRTPNAWAPDIDRSARVTRTRERERERMQAYVETDGCLMTFLTAELDDPADAPCERCANCVGPFAPQQADPAVVQAAQRFLKRAYRPIAPRKQWPAGSGERRGRIPAAQQLCEGRALCMYGDAGWGKLVADGKYRQGRFDEQLVEAVVEMLADWKPDPAPTWVTAVPSRRSPELVPAFARRLAARLGLPYGDALVKVRDTAPQKTMQNSFQQARNALAAFDAVTEEVRGGPVLLVDDMIDSGWSLTVCGVLLAEAGSGPVVPLALAQSTQGAQP